MSEALTDARSWTRALLWVGAASFWCATSGVTIGEANDTWLDSRRGSGWGLESETARGDHTRLENYFQIKISQQRAGGIAMGHARGRGMGCMDELPC